MEHLKLKEAKEIKRLEQGMVTEQEWRKEMGADISKEPVEIYVKDAEVNPTRNFVKKKGKSAFELWEVDPLNHDKIIDKNFVDYTLPANIEKAEKMEAEVVAYTHKLEMDQIDE